MIGLDFLFFDRDGRPAGRGLRLFRAVVVGGLAVGLVAVFGFVARRSAAVRRWPVVPCTILSSDVETDDGSSDREHPYKASVVFQFRYQGQSHVGHRTAVNDPGGSADAAEAYARAAEHPAGSTAACYVDPASPDEAVLVAPPAAWEPWAVPVSAAVAAVALLAYCVPQLTLAVWPAAVAGVAAVGVERRDQSRRLSTVGWGLVLLVGAGSAVWVWWGVPIVRTIAARRWPAVPCVVEASHLQRHRQAGEVPVTLYRTDVLFRYDAGGRAYHSNCYSLTESGSPSESGRAAAAADYPVGRQAVCYVDPADPTTATLTRRLSPTASFAVTPVMLAVLGGWMVAVGVVPQLAGPSARLVRRVRYTLGTLAVAAAAWTAWGVFGRP